MDQWPTVGFSKQCMVKQGVNFFSSYSQNFTKFGYDYFSANSNRIKTAKPNLIILVLFFPEEIIYVMNQKHEIFLNGRVLEICCSAFFFFFLSFFLLFWGGHSVIKHTHSQKTRKSARPEIYSLMRNLMTEQKCALGKVKLIYLQIAYL